MNSIIGTVQNSNVDRHQEICKELNELYERKNHDYGDSFHQTWLEEGCATARIRLSDKLSRFKRLSRDTIHFYADNEEYTPDDQMIIDESIRDTLIDLANYAIMTIMEMDLEKGSAADG